MMQAEGLNKQQNNNISDIWSTPQNSEMITGKLLDFCLRLKSR